METEGILQFSLAFLFFSSDPLFNNLYVQYFLKTLRFWIQFSPVFSRGAGKEEGV